MHSLFDSEVFEFLIFVIIAALATLGLVDRSDDWIANALQFLHLLVKTILVGVIVGVKPVFGLRERFGNGVFVVLVQLVGQLVLIFNCVAHLKDVVLECVLSVNAFLDGLIFVGELLSVKDHLLDLLFGEATLVVGNRNVFRLSGSLFDSADGQDGVLVNLESNFDLGNAPLRGWDACQIKLTELMVVLDERALSLKDSNGDGGLLVLVGGEGLRLLGWDDSTALDD